jgi:hypothetical protein
MKDFVFPRRELLLITGNSNTDSYEHCQAVFHARAAKILAYKLMFKPFKNILTYSPGVVGLYIET